MKPVGLLALTNCLLVPAFAAYQYDFPGLLNPYSASEWTINGTYSASNNMFTSSAYAGGALIFNSAVPGPASSYEVRTTITLTTSGGYFVTLLRASPGSLVYIGNSGTWYAIDLGNPTFSGSSCSATLYLIKSVSGSISYPGSAVVPCHNGMVLRAVMLVNSRIAVYIDNVLYFTCFDYSIAAGQPGIDVAQSPAGNGISAVDIGHQDTVAPNAVNPLSTSSFSNRVDLQWQAVQDDSNGTGVYQYEVSGTDGWDVVTQSARQLSDNTVASNTNYTYTISARDYHFNVSQTTVSVATPSTADARQVGVRSLGSYWGGGGEQTDMRSGNLNYTIPLLKALGRGGWGVNFKLSYNSQNWRQDLGGTWQFGRDTGYGYGWRLQAGSLTPVYQGTSLHHYVFIDSTGAEYRLDQNNGGVWSSREGIYVYYDSNAGRLYFTDGSFWVLGATSAGTEQDGGTLYPTLMQDSNGNQIILTYNAGIGVTWGNSSSRINTIQDVRGNGATDYTFTYNTDAIPHLTGITNSIGTSENYSFSYTGSSNLISPFNGQSFGSFQFMQTATATGVPLTTTFAYDNSGGGTSGTGELTQVTTPYGGHLRWAYAPYTLSGSRTFREVQYRYLSQSSGAAETTVQLSRANDTSYAVHSSATLDDLSANAEKFWSFQTDTTQFNAGLQLTYEERQLPNHTALYHQDFVWSQTPTSLNPYIGSTTTTLDPGQSYQAQKKTTQALDQYGNVTQMLTNNFGLGTARTYTNTYLTDSNYTSRYILNKLTNSTVTDGTYTTTLALNYYDSCGSANVTGLHEHDDANYGQNFTYRGNLGFNITPSTYRLTCYDIAGNVTSTSVNGVTTTATINSSSYYAAPSQITTNGLSSTMNWSSFLGLSSATGPNGDGSSIYYDTNARPYQTTSPYGAVTTYAYYDTASPPNKYAFTNTHWSQTIMDGFGRTIRTRNGYGGNPMQIVDTTYSPCGCSPLGSPHLYLFRVCSRATNTRRISRYCMKWDTMPMFSGQKM